MSVPRETDSPEMLRMGSARGRWVLLATVLGSAVASIDATVVGRAAVLCATGGCPLASPPAEDQGDKVRRRG